MKGFDIVIKDNFLDKDIFEKIHQKINTYNYLAGNNKIEGIDHIWFSCHTEEEIKNVVSTDFINKIIPLIDHKAKKKLAVLYKVDKSKRNVKGYHLNIRKKQKLLAPYQILYHALHAIHGSLQ